MAWSKLKVSRETLSCYYFLYFTRWKPHSRRCSR